MNLFLLYLLLVKATLTSFSGLTSLPVVRHDLVEVSGVLFNPITVLTLAAAAGALWEAPAKS